jgi:AcrR family transcriptional regulator
MARPSQQLDAAMLESGRALYPGAGCAGLSVRSVADHAGVNPGMFHYHFGSKDKFLRTLLAGLYEEMYSGLQIEVAAGRPAIERLRAALLMLARFLRENRRVIARVWMDAVGGEVIARDFMQANGPRHIGVLLALLHEAERDGSIAALPATQSLTFVLGAVGMPLIFTSALVDAGVAPPALRPYFDAGVMSDAAVAQRVDLALRALRTKDEP